MDFVTDSDHILTSLSAIVGQAYLPERYTLIVVAVGALAAVCLLIATAISERRVRSRLADIEHRLEDLARASDGPTVREFCADLTHELRMRLPNVDVPSLPETREADFIRGIVAYLKSRRRKSRTVVYEIEQLRSQISELTAQVRTLLERNEAYVTPQSGHCEMEALSDANAQVWNNPNLRDANHAPEGLPDCDRARVNDMAAPEMAEPVRALLTVAAREVDQLSGLCVNTAMTTADSAALLDGRSD